MKGHCARFSRGGARLGPAVFAALLVFPSIASARPVVAIISPSNNAPLSGEIWVTAAFRSDSRRPISRLELQCDGRSVQELVLPTAVPEGQKSFPINLSALPAGAHELSVVAVDTAGESGSASVTVSVSGGPGGGVVPPGYGSAPGNVGIGAGAVGEYDQIPPVVSIFYPAQGATVARTVPIRVEAKDNVAVRHVLFYVDGKLHTVRMTDPPFSANWDTTLVADGPHILEARAKDTQGNEGQAAPVTVIVRNSGPGPEPVVDPVGGTVVPGPVGSGPPVAPSPGGPTVVVPGVRQPAEGPEVAVPGPAAPPIGPTAPAGGGREAEAPAGPGAVVPRVIVPPVAVPPVPEGPGRDAMGPDEGAGPGNAADAGSRRPPAEAAAQPAEIEVPRVPTVSVPPKAGAAEPPKLPSRPGPQVTVPGTGLGAAGLTRPTPGGSAPDAEGGHATLKRAGAEDTSEKPAGSRPPAADAPDDAGRQAQPQGAEEPAPTATPPATETPVTGPETAVPLEGEAGATPDDLPAATAAAEPVPMPAATDLPLPETATTGTPGDLPGATAAAEPVLMPAATDLPLAETATTGTPDTLPAATAAGLPEPIVTHAGAVTTPGARLKLEPATTPPAETDEPGVRLEGEQEVAGEEAEAATGATLGEAPGAEPTAEPPTAPEQSPAAKQAADSDDTEVDVPSVTGPETVAAPAEAPEVRPAMPDGLTPTGVGAYHEGPKAAAPGLALDPSEGRSAPAAARPAAAVPEPSRAVEAPDDAEPAGGAATPPRAGLRRLPSAPRTSEPATTAAHPDPGTGRPGTVGPARPLTVADAAEIKTARVFAGDRPLPDDARPELVDDTLMISLKPVFEAFDGALYWFPGDRVARGVTADTDLAVQIGSTQATLNGKSLVVDPAPVLRNGRILAPISLVGRALSVGFEFDPAAKAVIIQ